MISVDLSRSLSQGGVLWEPAPGDRFTIDQPNVVGEVFWISHLTIDVHTFKGQPLLGFNGTTEWALDSVSIADALWLPREDQLRELLRATFRTLRRTADAFEVEIEFRGERSVFEHPEPAEAYGRALLAFIGASV